MLRDAKLNCKGEIQATPFFARFARWVERQVGRSSTFVLAIAVVVVWAISGPIFGWSDTWQLVINTGTTIVTFLMVFVIQNTQSRDTQAMQLKLDELIRVNEMARNSMINLEEMSDIDVERMKAAFAALASIETSASHHPYLKPNPPHLGLGDPLLREPDGVSETAKVSSPTK
jgi:low affinity Fe/Cu permease